MALAIDEIVYEFNTTNSWGIFVEPLAPGGEDVLMDLIDENFRIGEPPNIIAASSEGLLFWQENAAIIKDLNHYIHDAQWGLSMQEISEIPPVFWEQDKSDDQQLGIPALRDMQVLFYNRSWAEELGFFSQPDTLSEFREQVCTAAGERETVDETGGWIIDTEAHTMLSWILSSGNQDYVDTESGIYQFSTGEIQEIFILFRSLFDEGCAWQSRLSEPYDYFAHRQTLIYSGTLQDVIPQTQFMEGLESPDEWVLLPYPSNEMRPVILANGFSYAMLNASREEQLASWLFIRWLILPRNQADLAEINGFLPASISALDNMGTFKKANPHWEEATLWIPIVQSPPTLGSWLIVQNILEDAAWQTFQINMTVETIPQLLKQLDLMIPDVLEN